MLVETQVKPETQNIISRMNFKKMTSIELKSLFIEATDELNSQGLFYKEIADEIGMDEKRMRNIRTRSVNLNPSRDEMNKLFSVYSKRLAAFLKGEENKTKKLMELRGELHEEKKMRKQDEDEFRKELAKLRRMIELLEAENKLLKIDKDKNG